MQCLNQTNSTVTLLGPTAPIPIRKIHFHLSQKFHRGFHFQEKLAARDQPRGLTLEQEYRRNAVLETRPFSCTEYEMIPNLVGYLSRSWTML
jgi:hypothetical protein